MSSDLYHRIVQERGSLERLVARIPGFKGYQEKQARRTADTMLRDHLAAQIQQRIDRLIRIEKLILDQLGLAYVSKTRDLKGRIQTYHDKVATASPGYSGMWAQMKIGEEELDRIYTFDEVQFRYVDRFDAGLDKLEQAVLSKENVEQAIADLYDTANEAIEAFALRDNVITQIGQQY